MADIATMARKAEKFGQPGLAITDHGNMSGVFQLYRACHNHGILPFPGVEAYLVDDLDQKDGPHH
jgi:DNA polymerase-3 subunit alpha